MPQAIKDPKDFKALLALMVFIALAQSKVPTKKLCVLRDMAQTILLGGEGQFRARDELASE